MLIGLGNYFFFNIATKAQIIKAKINKWDVSN